ncbi:MAG: CHAD domain-containing protein, partial [Acidobacteria bacterium]|nr:CHAD domain-containing protein [Acidobacteriota bacterium]
HAFRLETKHLRDTLELFRALYGPGLAPRLEDLRKIQELLGQANDHVVAAGRLRERVRTDLALQPALAFLDNGAKSLQAAFRRYWRERMDAPEIEVRWANYLRRRKKP